MALVSHKIFHCHQAGNGGSVVSTVGSEQKGSWFESPFLCWFCVLSRDRWISWLGVSLNSWINITSSPASLVFANKLLYLRLTWNTAPLWSPFFFKRSQKYEKSVSKFQRKKNPNYKESYLWGKSHSHEIRTWDHETSSRNYEFKESKS